MCRSRVYLMTQTTTYILQRDGDRWKRGRMTLENDFERLRVTINLILEWGNGEGTLPLRTNLSCGFSRCTEQVYSLGRVKKE